MNPSPLTLSISQLTTESYRNFSLGHLFNIIRGERNDLLDVLNFNDFAKFYSFLGGINALFLSLRHITSEFTYLKKRGDKLTQSH